MQYSLEGLWNVELADGARGIMTLPGTLDENQLGHKDTGANQWHPEAAIGNADGSFDPEAPIATRFTRKYTYEGEARLTRRISFVPPEGKRIFLEAERARCLKLLVDGREIPDFVPPTISTPHIFEITGLLDGDNELILVPDNSYPGLPHDAIVYSSAATDETQTNWNGVLGYVRLRTEEPVFLSAVRVYPAGDRLTVQAEISAAQPYRGVLTAHCAALSAPVSMEVDVPAGMTQVEIKDLPLGENVQCWDEYEGNLYEMTVGLSGVCREPGESAGIGIYERTGRDGIRGVCGQEEKTVTFGIRKFGDDGKGRLALNGRTIFLRSEANCAEFPETGHPPMSVDDWLRILEIFKS